MFRRLPILHRVTLAQRIHDAAVPLVVALTPLGVSEPTLSGLQVKIAAATALLNEPRTTIINRHKATADLATLIDAIDLLLEKQIDGVMAPLALTHADLHDRYFQARKLPRQTRSAAEPANTAMTSLPQSGPQQQAA